MTSFLQLALALALMITAAKLGGLLSYRLGQPAVLGELALGIALGPSLVNFLGIPYFSDESLPEVIHDLAEMGVLLLMFLAGIELHMKDLISTRRMAGLAGGMGVVAPMILGTATGLVFGMDLQRSIFIGLILSATSVSISAQTLMELKVLRSRVGVALLGAAVFDDVLVLLGLSIFTALTQPGSEAGMASILGIVLKMALFLGVGSVIGYWAIPRLSSRVDRLPVSQGLTAFAFVTALLYGWAAEALGGMAAITGAFLAGLWFSRSAEKERIHRAIATVAYGIFVPIFFINVGLTANARELTWDSSLLMVVMALVAIVSKVLGAGGGGALGGLNRREALQLGVGMMSRGEVGLIVASLGMKENLIHQDTFAAVVGVVIVTTLLTPVLLRGLFSREQTGRQKPGEISEGVQS